MHLVYLLAFHVHVIKAYWRSSGITVLICNLGTGNAWSPSRSGPSPREDRPIPTGYEAGWAFSRRDTSFIARNRSPDRPARSLSTSEFLQHAGHTDRKTTVIFVQTRTNENLCNQLCLVCTRETPSLLSVIHKKWNSHSQD
jgi:hypothetical protein